MEGGVSSDCPALMVTCGPPFVRSVDRILALGNFMAKDHAGRLMECVIGFRTLYRSSCLVYGSPLMLVRSLGCGVFTVLIAVLATIVGTTNESKDWFV